ncbi:MAG: AMP-binding protein [Syntrophorhabdaceae bacterium]|nr:AMP-binding protein [Syntrophorhabdaceae bacterium]
MNFKKITIGKLVDEIAAQNAENDAMVYVSRNLRLNYRQFREECRKVARGLMSLGIRKGDHIGIWATNVPEWLILQFASARIGAVLITINTQYRPFELEYILRQSDTKLLILSDGFKDVSYPGTLFEVCIEVREAVGGRIRSEKFPRLRNVVYIGEKHYSWMMNWEEMKAKAEETSIRALDDEEASCDPEDVICIMYTSGTTGFPKGAMLRHRNIVANGANIGDCMNLSPVDRMCIPVPFFHCFGCVLGTMACVTHGSTMVPVESFSAQTVLETITKERCTAVHGVPTMFIAELEELEKNQGKYDLSHMRTGIMAGSPCPIEVMRAVIDNMNMEEITITYGLTEASPGITMTRTDDPIELRVATVGRPMPDTEVKIVDVETRKELPDEAQGELATRGYHVMKGYYKMPEATDGVIDPEGWLYTGDLAVRNELGYYKITGRAKDMIIRGGENIYPKEIEEFLYTHPKVLDVQVVGVPSKKYGEEVTACIRLRPGMEATPEEIIEYCKGKIARYKIPRFVIFLDVFPSTASGKIQKYKLREAMTKKLGLTDLESIKTA